MRKTLAKNALICAIVIILIMVFIYTLSINNKAWKKYSSIQVLGDETTGSLFDPNVIKLENGKYRMYVSSRKNSSISMSESDDGIHWSDVKVVFTNDGNTSWDKIINRCSVVYKDNVYKMYYTGQTKSSSKIGLAESIDGLNFEKIQDDPILVPEADYEQLNVMNPHVIFDEDEQTYKMWYSSGQQYEPDVICYATSKDGISWNKSENNPVMMPSVNENNLDSYKLGGCEVHKLDNNSWLMFYIGYTDINTARIFYATSSNGINWERNAKNLIIEPTKNSFDSEATYKPSAVYDSKENRWMLWYNGRTGENEYIGLAYCKDNNFNNKYTEYRR